MSEYNPDLLYDFSGIPEEEKDKMIRGFVEITSKHALELFIQLGLKTHFEVMVVNDANGDEFILSFKKINQPK